MARRYLWPLAACNFISATNRILPCQSLSRISILSEHILMNYVQESILLNVRRISYPRQILRSLLSLLSICRIFATVHHDAVLAVQAALRRGSPSPRRHSPLTPGPFLGPLTASCRRQPYQRRRLRRRKQRFRRRLEQWERVFFCPSRSLTVPDGPVEGGGSRPARAEPPRVIVCGCCCFKLGCCVGGPPLACPGLLGGGRRPARPQRLIFLSGGCCFSLGCCV